MRSMVKGARASQLRFRRRKFSDETSERTIFGRWLKRLRGIAARAPSTALRAVPLPRYRGEGCSEALPLVPSIISWRIFANLCDALCEILAEAVRYDCSRFCEIEQTDCIAATYTVEASSLSNNA
jgi:hypothetical protein